MIVVVLAIVLLVVGFIGWRTLGSPGASSNIKVVPPQPGQGFPGAKRVYRGGP